MALPAVVLVLLMASATLAAPSTPEAESKAGDAAVEEQQQQQPVEEAEDSVINKDRHKKQTTTICIQVAPAHAGEAPRVVCSEAGQLLQQQRVLQTPVHQSPGFYGSPHVVQLVPASASDSVSTDAADATLTGPSRADSVVISANGASPYFRSAGVQAGQQQPTSYWARTSEAGGPGAAPSAPPSPAAPAAPASPPPNANPGAEGRAQSNAGASAPAPAQGGIPQPAPDVASAGPAGPAAPAAHGGEHQAHQGPQGQARSFGGEHIIVSSNSGGIRGPFGPYGGPSHQTVSVTSGDPYLHGSTSQVEVISSPGVGMGPPLIGGSNYRAAEVVDQPRYSNTIQGQQTKASDSDPRAASVSATLLQQPLVVQKQITLPAGGSSSLSISAPVAVPSASVGVPQGVPTLAQLLNPLSPLSGLGHLAPLAAPPPLPQRMGTNVPVTLNCDLSTLAYSGAPQQQLQLKLAPVQMASVNSARSAEDDQLRQSLQAALQAAAKNRTVSVNLNGHTPQPGELSALQATLKEVQQREKDLLETIQTLQSAGAGLQENKANIQGLQETAKQIGQARAALEHALQPYMQAGREANDSAHPVMSPSQLLQQVRSSGAEFRYFPEPGPTSVVVGMSPSMHAPGIYPGRHQTTTTTVVSSNGYGGGLGRGLGLGGGAFGTPHIGFRAPETQPQQQQADKAQQLQQEQTVQQLQQLQQQQLQQLQQQRIAAAKASEPQPQPHDFMIQPAEPGAEKSKTQQELLQQAREAQLDLEAMRRATLPREEGRQASITPSPHDADEFPPTPGYQYVENQRAAPSASAPAGPANGPGFMFAPLNSPPANMRSHTRLW